MDGRGFVRDAWYVGAESGEVQGAPLPRILLGDPVVFYRAADGRAVALEDRCCHKRAPLSLGRIEGDCLACGYHGFAFDPSGACVRAPGAPGIPERARVHSYPVIERHRYLWIWMGDPAKADPGAIPDFHTNDDPDWARTGACLPVAGNYLLMIENLLDLSHVGFVHAGTIGSDDTSASIVWESEQHRVVGVRASTDIDTPPHNRRQGFGPRCDQTKVMTFLACSHITIDITTRERLPAGSSQAARQMHIMLLNSITPETEGRCHYFWSSTRDFAVDDAAVTEFFHAMTVRAFDEDRVMIEAQQRIIDLDPSAPTVTVLGDLGGVQARRLVSARLER
jgi:vanillate O-demethylase monooxygenase subunit